MNMSKLSQRLSLAGFVVICLHAVQAQSVEDKLRGEGGKISDAGETQLSRSAQLYQEEMAKKKEKWWSIDLRLSAEYDSNVRLDDDATGKDDARLVISGTVKANLPRWGDTRGSVYYSIYQDVYDELDEFDLEGHTLGLNFNRPLSSNLFVFMDYAFVYFYFDDEGYLQRHTLRPSLYWNQTNNLAGLCRFSWDNNDYPEVPQLSGDNWTMAVREFWYLGSNKQRYVYGEYTLNYYKAVQNFEAYAGHKFAVGGAYPLPYDFGLSAQVGYSNNTYKQGDPRFSDVFRSDNVIRGNARLTRPVYGDLLYGALYYRYTRQRSSIGARDYLNQVIGIELRLKF